MSLSRRQLLIWGGIAGGVGVTTLAHRLLAGQMATGSQSLAPTPRPAVAVGPAGMFAPLRGDLRLAVISDLNSSYGSTDYEAEVVKAIALLPEWKPDVVLCSGDMVAGQSYDLTIPQIQAMWAGFDRHIAKPLRQAKLAYGFTVGNHDASSATATSGSYLFAVERKQAANYWNDPGHNPGLDFVDRAGFPFYYTFQRDQIFYLVWDASSDSIPQSQLQWVEKSLASSAAQQAKLRIAIGHLPLYRVAVGRDKPGEFLADANRLRSLLEQYNVHTYISGHGHAYYPAYKGKLQLLHTGALGSGPRRWLNSDLSPIKTLTIVDVSLASGTTTYTTYNMSSLTIVDQRQLPRVIAGPNGTVVRRDVKMSDLTAEERSLTWTGNA